MFPFYYFSGKEDHTNAPLLPSLLLTRLNLSFLSFASVSFLPAHILKGFLGDCVPLLANDSCTTELNVPSDSVHHIPKSRSVQDKQDLVVSTQFTSVC